MSTTTEKIIAHIRRENPEAIAAGSVSALFRSLPEGGEYIYSPRHSGPALVKGDFAYLPLALSATAFERAQILRAFAPPSVPMSPAEKARARARHAAERDEER